MPNLADFDTVVVESCSLVDILLEAVGESRKVCESRIETVRERLRKLLKSGGDVYAIVAPPAYEKLEERPFIRRLGNEKWLPIPLEMMAEPCDTKREVDDAWKRYFDIVRRVSHVFGEDIEDLSEISAEHKGECHIQVWVYALARNRQGQPLGVITGYSAHPYGKTSSGKRREDWQQAPAVSSGRLVLLPPPTEVSLQEGIQILLEDFCGVEPRSLPPSWAVGISMPNDEDFVEAIAKAEGDKQRVEETLRDLLAKKEHRDSFKALLYEQSAPLQDKCRETFEAVGISTSDSPVSDEFLIHCGAEKALVEVTGTKKSIAHRDLSQLHKDIANYFTETKAEIKGVLVGNAWKDIPLEERDTADRPNFPNDVVRFATNHGIALVSGIELFRAYCAFLEGRLDGKTVFERLMKAAGIFKLAE